MELTIEQALQQGVAAHKEGKLEDAERHYRAILQSQPTHPDANHNLGVLAVSVNKVELALPLFRKALEANSSIEQFWLSYINALIIEQQFDLAKQVIQQGRQQGVEEEKLKILESQLFSKIQIENAGIPSPPQQHLTRLLEYYQNKQYDDAESLALSMTQKFPEHQFGWKVLGSVLKQTGRVSESLVPMHKSVQIVPQDADAHYNLGNTYKELGKLHDAESSYTQVIELKPNFAEAYNNLGNTLHELGRFDEAEENYTQAIALKPDYVEAHSNRGAALQELGRLEEAEISCKRAIKLKPEYAKAHFNLGVTLKEIGRLDEACFAYAQAINLDPDFTEAKIHFSLAIKNVRFNSSNLELYPVFTNILTTGNFARPDTLPASILSLLKLDPVIKDLLAEKSLVMSLNEVTSTIGALNKISLLHHLMRTCPLPDLQFERVFVLMRKVILKELYRIEVSPEFIYFLSTISLHCFINEYVYFESDEEKHLIDELQAKIAQTITQSEQPGIVEILCLASYRPLHHYDWCGELVALDELTEVRARLIEEPVCEKGIMKAIPALGEISNNVSLKVRKQYEENPYPRWVKLAMPVRAKTVVEVCDDVQLHLHSGSIKDVAAPTILIAGCGTGLHSIETASLFSGCQVTAVDLSLASLAYAQRKTTELGIANVEYFQADILSLGRLEQTFNIIECAGVLHHMDEPMAGWRVLTDLLKPGGLMKIGLYSELARQHIVSFRKEISSLKDGTSEAEIREFRQSIAESQNEHHQLLSKSGDFFSLSMLRDLLFHVQEHRFTLPLIKKCLDELGLEFCGFQNADAIASFREAHGVEADIYDMALWHQFEEKNPRTFAGMYQFWCQKP